MKNLILTGVQSTGIPHLGNILGSIQPAIELSKTTSTILFVADVHSLTTIRDAKIRVQNTRAVAAAYVALGFDTTNNILFKQSDRPEATELQFYLNCLTPFTLLQNSHAFKDKSDNLSDINVGVFTYPTLMAADILLYGATHVPVGKDQMQHLEIARDLARKFNNQYGEFLTIPDPVIQNMTQVVVGTDGRKMSKSYGNTINVFSDEKSIVKQVKSIVTDSTPVEMPKNPNTCNLFNIYKLVADPSRISEVQKQYLSGGLGYGKLKMELAGTLIEKYQGPRKHFNELVQSTELDHILKDGKKKAGEIAQRKIQIIRDVLGL